MWRALSSSTNVSAPALPAHHEPPNGSEAFISNWFHSAACRTRTCGCVAACVYTSKSVNEAVVVRSPFLKNNYHNNHSLQWGNDMKSLKWEQQCVLDTWQYNRIQISVWSSWEDQWSLTLNNYSGCWCHLYTLILLTPGVNISFIHNAVGKIRTLHACIV